MSSRAKEKYIFEESPIMKAIISLALPSIMGQIILVVYNMADAFFIGLTGNDAMFAAIGVCTVPFMFLSAISNLFGVGGASVISRFMGAGERDKAKRASAFAIWGCGVVALLYTLGSYILLDGFVDLLGGSEDAAVHSFCCQYMLIVVVIGGIPTALSTLFSHIIRAEGRSMQASIGIIIGGVLNIVLDPLFMFVILEPGNEILGAALATMLSNCLALVYFIVYIMIRRKEMVLSPRPGRDMFRDRIPRDVISIGIPACLMTLCENISYAVLEKLMSGFGTAAQAGIGAAKKVNMLAHSIARGMTQGVLPLIGYNFASGNRKRMRHTVYLSASISIGISIVCMTTSLLFSHPLVDLFLEAGGESHSYGSVFLMIMCVGAPFSAWAYTVISFFQATGHMTKSLILALMRKGILDIPLMFILNAVIPIYGIVCATPAADIVCCITASVLFVLFMKKHGNDIAFAPKAEDLETLRQFSETP